MSIGQMRFPKKKFRENRAKWPRPFKPLGNKLHYVPE